ncbi:MAG: TetR/AcrR family transcriptional regulator [Proteiniphilum sp.]|nr:TetR/AcrR family transcriptional regulator [Proteiniphilum sp.]
MELHERIIEKAGNLFIQYGVKNSSMDEIATSLGISKRTIYEIFRDKEELLISFLKKTRDERNAYFADYLCDEYNVIEVFLKIIEAQQNMPMANVKFFEDIRKYYPRAAKLIQEEVDRNNAFLRKFLRKGIGQGFIRENLNVDVTAFLVEDSTYTYIRASYLEQPPFSFRELFFTMMINFIRGISTEKGIRIIDEYLANQEKKQISQDE